ncbi:MAG: undecaprenyl-phosphate glucose phosphotransferase [Rubrivivax sp.]
MFEHRPHSPKNFLSAPQSVGALIAAFLEPAVMVLCYVVAMGWRSEPFGRADLVLCLLVFTLIFPGRNRFRQRWLAAAVDILVSWVGLLAILLLCGWATQSLRLYRADVLLAWIVATPVLQFAAVLAGQYALRLHDAKPANRRPAVVLGAGPLGLKVAEALSGAGDRGIDFAGFFDDRGDERVGDLARQRLLGPLAEARPYILAHGIREVYITLPLGSQPRIVKLLEELQDTTASIFFVPDVFGISIIHGRMLDLEGVPVVGIGESPFTGTNALVKRLSDLVIASLIVLLIAPLLAVLALGVKLSSPGPVIFRQRRSGLDGEEIVVYKFRSMRTMEDGARVRQATRDDPRITPFGAFLRRTSLDELPQFINVLQGRMSIVGPRPHALAHNEQYRELVRAYMVRHKVRPGITGWAQINGLRGETDTIDKMRARVEYDLQYLRNWSLRLDLQIIARTVKLVFFDRSAY